LSITATVLTFVGIPAAIVAVVYGAVYASGARQHSKRYRPGRPFDFVPVWFLAASDEVTEGGSAARALTEGEPRESLPAGPLLNQASDSPARVAGQHGETGGASDSW
jgi:hypothetical protein